MQNSRTGNISARFGPHAGRADVRPAFVKGLLEAAWSTLRWRWRCKPNLGTGDTRISSCKLFKEVVRWQKPRSFPIFYLALDWFRMVGWNTWLLSQKATKMFQNRRGTQHLDFPGNESPKCPNSLTPLFPFGGKISARWRNSGFSGGKLELFWPGQIVHLFTVAAFKRLFWLRRTRMGWIQQNGTVCVVTSSTSLLRPIYSEFRQHNLRSPINASLL